MSESVSAATSDIGALTWPRVDADVECDRPDGIEALHGAFLAPEEHLAGTFALAGPDLSGTLRLEPADVPGLTSIHLEIAKAPGATHYSARVRESWLLESAKGATSRLETARRIAGAIVALARIPGQRTVAIE